MARPVFILGLQRSGTTWIGNLLAAHPEVAAVTAVRHGGIHESLFFSHFARAWDWDDPRGRAAALQAFVDSDYCRLMDLDDREKGVVLTSLSAAEAFDNAMDLYAARQQAAIWVEKSPHHTRHAREIAKVFPDASFVAIYRSTPSLIQSRLGAYGRTPPQGARRVLAILRAAASNAFHRAEVSALARRYPDRVIQLDFEVMKADRERQVERMLTQLGISQVPDLQSDHQANATPDSLRDVTVSDLRLAWIGDLIAGLVPGAVLGWIRRRLVQDSVRFPGWVWSSDRRTPDEFMIAPTREEREA